MAKHTPGPWEVEGSDGLDGTYVELIVGPLGDDRRVITEITPYDSEDEGNARLIAAAPDLLEACEKARKDYNNINYPTEEHKRVMGLLDAAIKKAKGGDQDG